MLAGRTRLASEQRLAFLAWDILYTLTIMASLPAPTSSHLISYKVLMLDHLSQLLKDFVYLFA